MRSFIPRSADPKSAMGRIQLSSGLSSILVGCLTFALSNVFEGGFVQGFFQGVTVALMVLGAYLIGSSLRSSRKDDDELRDEGHWLPSRDGRRDGNR